MELAPYMSTRRLTRCMTVNSGGEARPRFVEWENFKLWHYLVTNRHGLQVTDELPCLWVPAGDFSQRASVYSHAGDVEPVNRVVISLFDEELGFTSVIERFAHRSEVFTLMNILNAHLSTQVVHEESLESAVIPGYAVEPLRASSLPNPGPSTSAGESDRTLFR